MRFYFVTVLVLSTLLLASADAWRFRRILGRARIVITGKRANDCEDTPTPQQVEELQKTCQDLNDDFKDGLSQEDIYAFYAPCDSNTDKVLLDAEIECFSDVLQAVQNCAALEENKST